MKNVPAIFAFLFITATQLFSQNKINQADKAIFQPTSDSINFYMSKKAELRGKIYVERAVVYNENKLKIVFSTSLSEYPIRKEDIINIHSIIQNLLPPKYKKYRNNISVVSGDKTLEELSSPFFSEEKRSDNASSNAFESEKEHPLTKNISKAYQVSKGLQGRHIALWQSHGYYYEQSLKRWEWQRARIFETVEDLYTQSYVLPFLVPMLENAGANVLLPRERDVQTNEIIVDNDSGDYDNGYKEVNGKYRWTASTWTGFANPKKNYLYGENPFQMGTSRSVRCIIADDSDNSEKISYASWIPHIPENGEYSVYISYGTVKNSTENAKYEVRHNGGSTFFQVNQKMGGGTWIYLGTFGFEKDNENQGVYLSNIGNKKKEYVTADAVKFGGGMGNIARKPAEKDADGKDLKVDFPVEPEVSGYPRFTEGARYWLQWAGMADTVYSPNSNMNDYNDDYQSRGKWVNALAGGSSRLKEKEGYKIPIDLAFAFHSDAGTTLTDSIIGTLSIYTSVSEGSSKYKYGGNRMVAREMTDIIQTQIIDDIRKNFEPDWKRRGLWDKSYSESRSPEVPSMLLELLSHQNFADMRYGLDPSFRFTVSRSIYKGILKYISYINNEKYTIQPLPVNSFTTELYSSDTKVNDEGKYVAYLYWKGTEDPLEDSASPNGYILYTRITDPLKAGEKTTEPQAGIDGFDNGIYVKDESARVELEKGKIYSFKVTAVNDGGESFPSEILSIGITSEEVAVNASQVNKINGKGRQYPNTVMVVNGFTRISSPAHFASSDSSRAGFENRIDGGVPYLRDISFIGSMYEFRRNIPWMDDDSPGFGASFANYENKVIAGNTFDYPLIHGAAIMKAGYNFVSASKESVCDGFTDLKKYPIVDIIAGKEISTPKGRRISDSSVPEYENIISYEVFPEGLQRAVTAYCNSGGSVMVSGANIATDIWDQIYEFKRDSVFNVNSKKFAQNVLKYKWMTNQASLGGDVRVIQNPLGFSKKEYSFYTKPNMERYCVESPDGLIPSDKNAYTILRYSENNISAAVAYYGTDYRCVSLGFPIETLTNTEQIDAIISDILSFFGNESVIQNENPTPVMKNIKSSESKK